MIITRDQWDDVQRQLSQLRARVRQLEGKPSCCEHPLLTTVENCKRMCITCGWREP